MYKTSIILNAALNEQEYLAASIDNIRRFTERGAYELIVVEHGGSLERKEWLADQTDILTLFHDSPLTEGQVWNRGIEVSSGNSVLLLHSDTLVTEYWLDFMIQSLYQNEDIAGVGPLSNHAFGDQVIEINYDSMEGLLQFGRNCNRSFGLKQQVTLSGFCLFLKRDVIDSIGSFHEQLQGHDLTVDYCLRIAQAKYRLMVCTNVFVHHYGIENENDVNSSLTFKIKWGFSSLEVLGNSEYKTILPVDASAFSRVLVVGSGFGNTLLSLRQSFPEAELHGVEFNSTVREISQGLCPDSIHISSTLQDYKAEQGYFDYIMVNTTCNVQEVMEDCYRLLTGSGILYVNIPNVYHHSTISKLMKGAELERHQLTDWSLDGIKMLLERADFKVSTVEAIKEQTSSDEQAFIRNLKRINPEELSQLIEIRRFMIVANKIPDSTILHERFNQLFLNPSEELVEQILLSSSSSILQAANTYSGPVVPLLNYLAISYYEREEMQQVFPLLSRAHVLAPEDPTTLLNLGTVYYGAGDDEKALYWLRKIQDRNEQIEGWIYQLQETISLKNDTLKWIEYLLLRVEHGVRREESMNEFIDLLDSREVGNQLINVALQNVIEDKLSTINILVNYLFEQKKFNHALEILELLLNYQDNVDETLFILANLSLKLNNLTRALCYIEKISLETEKVSNLKTTIINLQLAERIRK
ncbi:glycosyltransferase [uncultured Paenibacillus sp.]|uniref:glycosyltransferase n=1 Tax=uncultured Paenibacillus sp. TaxID=227322 RepID=UPI0015AFD298|nr:glycosyltransferase [uncultured Paenibacillus sp.]